MGNRCCGDRGPLAEYCKDKPVHISSSSTGYTADSQFSSIKGILGNSTFADKLKETLKEIEVIEKKKRTSGHKRGKCPYCSSTFEFSRQLKFIECTKCEQVSMQDGVTRSLYK